MMTFLSFLAVIPTFLIGILFVCIFYPGGILSNFLFKLFLGSGLGIGITSQIYYLWSYYLSPDNRSYYFLEFLLIVILIIILIWQKKLVFNSTTFISIGTSSDIKKVFLVFLALSLLATIIVSALSFFSFVQANPHGAYDAYAIWNLHARIIYRGNEGWQFAFDQSQYHADYPLLIPVSIVRVWSLLHYEALRTPVVIAFVFMVISMGLLFSSIQIIRGTFHAIIATLVLAGTPWFIRSASYLYADVPTAFYVLAAILLIYFSISGIKNQTGFLFLGGFSSGLAAWTKNEGIQFLVILSSIMVIHFFWQGKMNKIITRKKILVFLTGILVPLVVLIHFKLKLAPKNDLFVDQTISTIIFSISSPDRYVTILKNFIEHILVAWNWPNLLCLMFIFILWKFEFPFENSKIASFFNIIIIASMLIGYFIIYLIAPWDPEVHMRTSADRILIHLFPAFLLTLIPLIRIPDFLRSDMTKPHFGGKKVS